MGYYVTNATDEGVATWRSNGTRKVGKPPVTSYTFARIYIPCARCYTVYTYIYIYICVRARFSPPYIMFPCPPFTLPHFPPFILPAVFLTHPSLPYLPAPPIASPPSPRSLADGVSRRRCRVLHNSQAVLPGLPWRRCCQIVSRYTGYTHVSACFLGYLPPCERTSRTFCSRRKSAERNGISNRLHRCIRSDWSLIMDSTDRRQKS